MWQKRDAQTYSFIDQRAGQETFEVTILFQSMMRLLHRSGRKSLFAMLGIYTADCATLRAGFSFLVLVKQRIHLEESR